MCQMGDMHILVRRRNDKKCPLEFDVLVLVSRNIATPWLTADTVHHTVSTVLNSVSGREVV